MNATIIVFLNKYVLSAFFRQGQKYLFRFLEANLGGGHWGGQMFF